MPLQPGVRLGPYEIRSALGAGGMGEVYRARDSRLAREVAVKVLPPAFSADVDRLQRFEQEARAAAALNHPNILAVFDLGQHDGAPYIVAELLEGETLRERLSAGALPVRKAVEYAIQIAHGLAAAHDKGIVHRDLKPENVFITTDGRVKILDFGLAKLTQPEPAVAGMSTFPTTPANTNPGMVLGTMGYMSPEQVRGLAADHRSDIFAFGSLLYEMLSGRRAFTGDTTIDAMTAILKEDPPALPSAERHIPPALERLVDRCLEKNAGARFQSTRDLAFALEGLSHSETPSTISAAPLGTSRKHALSLAAAVVVALVAGAAIWSGRSGAPTRLAGIMRLTLALPDDHQVATLENPAIAISHDGRRMAYVGSRVGGQAQLYLRPLDSLESKPIAGTEGGSNPFFSPDGQWLGFRGQGKLKKVPLTGGAVQTLSDATSIGGASWGPDDYIYFPPTNNSGLWKVPASGGTPTEVTRLDRDKGEISHRWPQVLPGGGAVLFTVWTGPGFDERHIGAQSLTNGERHLLVQGGDTGRYAPTGHLIYARGDTDALMAVPLDLSRLDTTVAAPMVLAEQVRVGGEGAQYAFSDFGEFVYVPGDPRRYERQLVWIDRQGNIEPLPASPARYDSVQISPDGRRAILNIERGTVGIWTYDFSRATLTPLTTPGSSQAPKWTPDGNGIVYRGTRKGFRNLYWKAADGTGEEQQLTKGDRLQTPQSVSRDGKLVIFAQVSEETSNDLWTVSLDGAHDVQPLIATRFNESLGRLSPDAQWLAYTSDESGRTEIYVQRFPGGAERQLVSTGGGIEPTWSPDGRELFYRNGDRMMAVDVRTEPTFSAQPPRLLFERRFVNAPGGSYTIAPDGRRFLTVQPVNPEPPATQINVVHNWFEELKRLAPAR